eukprot:1372582-Amorphochlora_amoeboformis.AAC.1
MNSQALSFIYSKSQTLSNRTLTHPEIAERSIGIVNSSGDLKGTEYHTEFQLALDGLNEFAEGTVDSGPNSCFFCSAVPWVKKGLYLLPDGQKSCVHTLARIWRDITSIVTRGNRDQRFLRGQECSLRNPAIEFDINCVLKAFVWIGEIDLEN